MARFHTSWPYCLTVRHALVKAATSCIHCFTFSVLATFDVFFGVDDPSKGLTEGPLFGVSGRGIWTAMFLSSSAALLVD